MKKLSLILTMLFCATSVFAATTTTTTSTSSNPSNMTMDHDTMMEHGKAYCESHHMSSKDCKADMEKWKNATPDQKVAMMKERWGKMTPDEKKAAMDRMMMKYNAMDADSQKAMIQMMMNGNTSKQSLV